MLLDDSTFSAVNNYNYKANAERATQNMDAHQQAMQLIQASSIGQIVNKMNGLDIAEAVSISKVATSDLSGKVAALIAALSAGKQMTAVSTE